MSYDPVQWQLDRQAEAALHTREFHKHHPEYLTPKEEKTVSKTIPKEIRGTVPVWFSNDFYGPQHLSGSAVEAINSLTLYDPGDHKPKGWTLVGRAEIVITTEPVDTIVANKVEALREEKAAVLAEAQAKATSLETKIQQLLAISYDAPAEVAP